MRAIRRTCAAGVRLVARTRARALEDVPSVAAVAANIGPHMSAEERASAHSDESTRYSVVSTRSDLIGPDRNTCAPCIGHLHATEKHVSPTCSAALHLVAFASPIIDPFCSHLCEQIIQSDD